MVALSRVLNRVQLAETFSTEQRQSLVEQIGSSDSTIFQNLDVFAFADKLREAGAILDDSQIDAVAEHIRSEMLRLGVLSENVLSSAPAVPQQVQFPTSIKWETDRVPTQLSLAELLKKLGENPSDLELKNELLSRQIVVQATTVAGTRFAFKTESEFDANKTLRFLNHLASGKPAPRKFEDAFAVSLDAALGIQNLIWFNPLISGQKLYDGVDFENDQNWNEISQTTREAVLWARFTQHNNFPKGDIDVWSELDRISSGTGRWKNIVEDYQRFIAEGNAPVALKFVEGIEEFVGVMKEENQPKKSEEVTRNPSGKREQAIDPLSRLRGLSEGSDSFSGARTIQPGIYSEVSVSGSVTVDRIICLNGGSCSGASRGTMYVPQGVRISMSGASSVQVLKRSPDELYAIAQSLDLV